MADCIVRSSPEEEEQGNEEYLDAKQEAEDEEEWQRSTQEGSGSGTSSFPRPGKRRGASAAEDFESNRGEQG